jgi:hypothetical protein
VNTYQQTNLRAFAFDMLYEGTLLHKAEVRTKLLDGCDHAVPVVCMEVELDNGMHTHMHVEHPYPMGQHDQAAREAAGLKRGKRVSVTAPALDMRLVARNATAVHAIPEPATAPPVADLFQEPAAHA